MTPVARSAGQHRATLTAILAAGLNLRSVTGLPLVVFSPPTETYGVALANVTAHTVPDRTATLRSRR